MTLRIFLADLSHVGCGVATEGMPLNIGLLASFAGRRFGTDVQFTLFKYPGDLLEAIRENPPHILGCSNYTWNSNLSYHFTRMVKSINDEIFTVWGGTNYPFDAAGQNAFLRSRPGLDLHTFYEGEIAFSNILERVLSAGSRDQILAAPIDGVQFIRPGTGEFVSGAPLPRIRELDQIPSPYVAGLMDKFFDGVLTPLAETARGCPFRCNFCNAADSYYTKVNRFSDDYVREEFSYIAKKASEADCGHLTLTDNNFGMIPRDAETAILLHDLRQEFGWPKSISAWTGKNAKERVIDVTRLLGNALTISMSVQSMSDTVLENINRDNIKLDHMRAISTELHTQGRAQLSEVIMPLPGETLASHIEGINQLLDTNVSMVTSHTLQVLHGTPYKDSPEFRDRWGYVTRWRLVPLDFSRIDGTHIFDVEEVAVASKDMSFEHYVEARKYLFICDLCFNVDVFAPLKKFLTQNSIPISSWVASIFKNVHKAPNSVQSLIASFARETVEELWESEEALLSHYSDSKVYQKVVDGEIGGNVLFKHRVRMYTQSAETWVSAVFDLTQSLAREACGADSHPEIESELNALRQYVLASISHCFSVEGIAEEIDRIIDFDIPAWLSDDDDQPLRNFRSPRPMRFVFAFTPQDAEILHDGFKRYGTDIGGLVKLMQRVSNLGVGFRQVKAETPDRSLSQSIATESIRKRLIS
jgi:hypothetical protein